MIHGDPISVDLRTQDVAGLPCVVLEMIQIGGKMSCRWEADANQYQVAAALERLAERLRKNEI